MYMSKKIDGLFMDVKFEMLNKCTMIYLVKCVWELL
jgi:hypothetical protein